MMRGVNHVSDIISISLRFLAVSLTFHYVVFDVSGMKFSGFPFVLRTQNVQMSAVVTPHYRLNPRMNGV
jgi:hypothetical protein